MTSFAQPKLQEQHVETETFLPERTDGQIGRTVATIKKKQIDKFDELENYKRLLKRRKKHLFGRIATIIMLLIIAPVMIFLGSTIVDRDGRHDFFGYSFYIVISQSMEPEIMVDDCVVLSKVTDVNLLTIGDDIGYINDYGEVVVHRIVRIEEAESGGLCFETRGINNQSSDQKLVGYEQIVGKRVSTLSWLGSMVVFFRSPVGIVTFLAMVALITIGFILAFKHSENIKYIEIIE